MRTMRIADLHVEQRADGPAPPDGSRAAPCRSTSGAIRFGANGSRKLTPHAFDRVRHVGRHHVHGSRHGCADVLARSRNGEGTLEIRNEDDGLHFAFDAPNTTRGNDLLELVRRGDISECSFKFKVEENIWTWRNEANGLEYDQRVVTKISKLYDLSIVVNGAYRPPRPWPNVRQLTNGRLSRSCVGRRRKPPKRPWNSFVSALRCVRKSQTINHHTHHEEDNQRTERRACSTGGQDVADAGCGRGA